MDSGTSIVAAMPIEEGPVDLVFMVNKGRIELDWLEFIEAR